MRKKCALLFIASIVGLGSFAFSSTYEVHKKLYADYSPYTYIGKCFKYEHVDSLTKVYCLGEYYQYALAAGREIYTELSGGLFGNQNDPNVFEEYSVDYSLLNQSNPIHTGVQSVPLVSYYYYATPSLPKIVGCHDMYNDTSSLIFAIEVLEDEAEYLDIADTKNAILSYIRCINVSYTSENWETVAGVFDDGLINSFATFTVGGVEINEFFASFVSNSSYNTDYGLCRNNYLNYNLPFIDCYERETDLIHMFSSIDAVFENTGESTDCFSFFITETSFRFLSSWAGDLQTAAVYVSRNNLNNYTFEDILDNTSSSFDYLDFYADVNAINIAGGLDLDDVNSISSLVTDYFVLTLMNNPYYPRIGSFMDTVELMDGHGDSSIFVEIVYHFLGLDPNGDNMINPTDPNHVIKYKLLGLDIFDLLLDGVPSAQYRKNLADEFWYYCNLHRNYYDN